MALAMGLETKRLTEAIKDIIDEVKTRGSSSKTLIQKPLLLSFRHTYLAKSLTTTIPMG
jgi:hypothetical protein